MISSADLKEVINRLTGQDHLLSEEQMQQLIDNVRLGFFASVVSFVSSFFYIQLLLCSNVCILWTLPNPYTGWARVIPILWVCVCAWQREEGQWYGCQCLQFLTCTLMSLYIVAHMGCANSARESALKVDSGRKIPPLTKGL